MALYPPLSARPAGPAPGQPEASSKEHLLLQNASASGLVRSVCRYVVSGSARCNHSSLWQNIDLEAMVYLLPCFTHFMSHYQELS